MPRTSPASVNARRTSYTAWRDTVGSQVRPMAGPTLLSPVIRSANAATLLDRDLRDIFISGEQLQAQLDARLREDRESRATTIPWPTPGHRRESLVCSFGKAPSLAAKRPSHEGGGRHDHRLVTAENAQAARIGLVQVQLGAGEKLRLRVRHGRLRQAWLRDHDCDVDVEETRALRQANEIASRADDETLIKPTSTFQSGNVQLVIIRRRSLPAARCRSRW